MHGKEIWETGHLWEIYHLGWNGMETGNFSFFIISVLGKEGIGGVISSLSPVLFSPHRAWGKDNGCTTGKLISHILTHRTITHKDWKDSLHIVWRKEMNTIHLDHYLPLLYHRSYCALTWHWLLNEKIISALTRQN